MSKKVFISFNFKDSAIAKNVKPFFNNQGGKCQGKPVYVENDVSDQGDKAIDDEIKSVMSSCDAILFVVGDESHNSPWINREAEIAISQNLGIVAVQAPDTIGGVPNEIKENNVPLVNWDKDALCNALNKV